MRASHGLAKATTEQRKESSLWAPPPNRESQSNKHSNMPHLYNCVVTRKTPLKILNFFTAAGEDGSSECASTSLARIPHLFRLSLCTTARADGCTRSTPRVPSIPRAYRARPPPELPSGLPSCLPNC